MDNKKIEDKIKEIKIFRDNSILSALKIMDLTKSKLLLVFEKDKFYSLISIGDIQRAIISNVDLNSQISKILRSEVTFSFDYENLSDIKSKMLKSRIEFMPILNAQKELIDVFFWEDVFSPNDKPKKELLNIPVIIMAGGKGKRLQPLTNVFPKPLLPINDKTIIENIIDTFVDVGCVDFFLSINYKSKTIKHFFLN